MLTRAEQCGGDGQGSLTLQRLDRYARRNATVERQIDDVVGGLRRGRAARGKRDHVVRCLGPTAADRILGLTKHTKQMAIFLVVGLAAAAVVDLLRGRTALLAEWPSLVSTAVALTWILAATDDFRMGTQHRIPKRIENEGARHPIGWYRFFLTRILYPVRVPFGWLIPGSMYLIAAAYLAGILVQPAALGALFLLANMFLFLNLRSPRDDFVGLAIGNLVVLATNPGGLPALARALGAAI